MFSGKRVKVRFFRIPLAANGRPLPVARQIQPCQCPDFDFLPGVLGQKNLTSLQHALALLLQHIHVVSARIHAIPIHQQQKQLHHSRITLNYFLNPLSLQGFADSTHQRIEAHQAEVSRFALSENGSVPKLIAHHTTTDSC